MTTTGSAGTNKAVGSRWKRQRAEGGGTAHTACLARADENKKILREEGKEDEHIE